MPLDKPLESNVANSFLGLVAEILAGILAIVLSVSIFAVELSSDKYSPRILSLFRDAPTTKLVPMVLLGVILLSVLSSGVDTAPMYQWGFISVSWLFGCCLVLMLYYVRQTLWLIDPHNLLRRKLEEGLKALQTETDVQPSAISELGDIAVKAFSRGEEMIADECLSAISEIQTSVAGAETGAVEEASMEQMPRFLNSRISSDAVSQYFRLYKLAVRVQSETFTRRIAQLLGETVNELAEQTGSKAMLRGVMLQQYGNFVTEAIERGDSSRLSLVGYLGDALCSPRAIPLDEHGRMLAAELARANRIIIDHDDSFAWDGLLSRFSSFPSLGQLSKHLEKMWTRLQHQATLKHPDMRQSIWDTWHYALDKALIWMTDSEKTVLLSALATIRVSVSDSDEYVLNLLRDCERTIQRLWGITRIYDVFFESCVYALYRGRISYIKELWRHTNPPDSDATWINANLIHFHPGYLTRLMYALCLSSPSIDGFHGAEAYRQRYYLLCLAYALHRGTVDWLPAVPATEGYLATGGGEDTEPLVQLIQQSYGTLLNLPHYAERALSQLQAVVETADDWQDLFNSTSSEAIQEARDWLSDPRRRQEWTRGAQSIVESVPLEQAKVDSYVQEAVIEHQRQTHIPYLAQLTEADLVSDNGQHPVALTEYDLRDKAEFTILSPGDHPQVDYSVIHTLCELEVLHLLDRVAAHQDIRTTRAAQLSFRIIAEAAYHIVEQGLQPEVLLAPYNQIDTAWQTDTQFKEHDSYSGNDRYLIINKTTKLRILEVNGSQAFVLSPASIHWHNCTPVNVSVSEHPRYRTKTRIAASEVIRCKLVNPGGIEVVEFTT